MSETLEELKAIVDNAPKCGTATHIDQRGSYIKDNFVGCQFYHLRIGWIEFDRATRMRSLSDIKLIIELMEDKLRLDHLQKCNEVFNKRAGSNYGWRVEWNHNRIAVVDTGVSGVSIRRAIDEHIKKVGLL